MSNEVLFLSHRMPFPPDRGDKIRSHHILKRIASLAPVHVATFADDERDIAEEVELAAIAQSYRLIRRVKPLVLAGTQALLSNKPVSLPAFYSAELAQYVETILRERPISTIYIFSGQMGQYVPADFAGKIICDLVDVDSAKFEAYAQRQGGVRGWLFAREARLLAKEEARLAVAADQTTLVSEEEAALFRSRLSPQDLSASKVVALKNGIDSRHFDPSAVRPEAQLMACDGPRLIFSGQMDYSPNVDAVVRAIDRLMPRIRETIPGATFHIVGRNPDPEIQHRDGKNGCKVWGGVDDMRTWLSAADVALVPLEIARGVQNKVLEAMAMQLPVVLTAASACGIGGKDGQHFLIGDSDEELVDRVTALLSHPRQGLTIGLEARRFVVEELSWQATLVPLSSMIGRNSPRSRNAA